MKRFVWSVVAATIIGFGTSAAFAAEYESKTACKAGRAWDAAAAKCVKCENLVTDAGAVKRCRACKGGTAWDVTAAKCVTIKIVR